MIDLVAVILSIAGTPFIAMKTAKLRFLGFATWSIANTLWMIYGWTTSQWTIWGLFFWYQIWCVFGLIGSWKSMKTDINPMLVSPPGCMKSEMMKNDQGNTPMERPEQP